MCGTCCIPYACYEQPKLRADEYVWSSIYCKLSLTETPVITVIVQEHAIYHFMIMFPFFMIFFFFERYSLWSLFAFIEKSSLDIVQYFSCWVTWNNSYRFGATLGRPILLTPKGNDLCTLYGIGSVISTQASHVSKSHSFRYQRNA